MHIHLLGPFEKLAGKEIELELLNPITLREFIPLLVSRYQGFDRYAILDQDSSLSAHICFLRKGRPLKLLDQLHDQDTIQILLPMTGG